jgi:hypothetical protein
MAMPPQAELDAMRVIFDRAGLARQKPTDASNSVLAVGSALVDIPVRINPVRIKILNINLRTPKAKPPPSSGWWGLALITSLTMTYFHTGIRTIIGADSFHCPVRDGKEWDQVAMVVRLDWLVC